MNTAKDIGKADNDGTIRVRLEVVEGSDSQLHGSSDADVDFLGGFARLKAVDAQRSLDTGVVIKQSTSGCSLTSYFTKSAMADMSPVSRV